MKSLVDMNLSPRWISVLADSDIEATHWALRQMAAELEEGALLTVDPNRTRLRLLPLQKDKQNLSGL